MSETLDGPARAIAIPFGTRIVTSRSLYSTRHEADGTMHIDAERMAISELVRILTVGISLSGRDLRDEILAVSAGASLAGVIVQLGTR